MDFETDFKVSHSEYPQYFRRLFTFQKTKEWILPDKVYKASKFHLSETQEMKIKLNNVKGELSEFDLGQWSKHTHDRDIAGYVMDHLRKKVKPELMTQAWCKFYEIINTLSVISEIVSNSEIFTSLHLCEAPGAFICALNHYLALEYPILQWEWLANTLNPNYEGTPLSQMIPDDRLIRHTLTNWLFGLDLTGDIQKYYNHESIIKQIVIKKVSLVTADGSINCMTDPGEQERLVEFLHYCETVTAMSVLKKGGSFILKIFTIFEDSTVCLLYFLNCVFKQVSVFKPCTSKSGNSEVYVICKEYVGIEAVSHIWADFVQPYKNGGFDKNLSMFSKDSIPNCFYLQVLNCAEYFMERQMSTIKDNIYYYLNPDKTESAILHKLKLGIANEYLRKFKIKHIPSYRRIVPYINVHVHKRKFEDVEGLIFVGKNSLSVSQDCLTDLIDIKIGKTIDEVYNSKFISKNNLEILLLNSCKRQSESSSSLYNLTRNYLSKNSIVTNVSDFKLAPYHNFQKSLFLRIKDVIFSRKNLIFINTPFHTQFLAGLWCLVATVFEEVFFFPGFVIFSNPLGIQSFVPQVLDDIEKCYNNLQNNLFVEDILQIFTPEAFDHKLNVIKDVLNICNSSCLYEKLIK